MKSNEEVLEFVRGLWELYTVRQDDYSLGSAHLAKEVELFLVDGWESAAFDRAVQETPIEDSNAYKLGYNDAEYSYDGPTDYDVETAYDDGFEAGYSRGFEEGEFQGNQNAKS